MKYSEIHNKVITRLVENIPSNIQDLNKYEALYQEKIALLLQQIKSIDKLEVARGIRDKKENELRQNAIVLIEIEIKIADIVFDITKENNTGNCRKTAKNLGLNVNVHMKRLNIKKNKNKAISVVNNLITDRKSISVDNISTGIYNIKRKWKDKEYIPLNNNNYEDIYKYVVYELRQLERNCRNGTRKNNLNICIDAIKELYRD